ncbi:MAG: hypothetical protein ABSG02_07835 [Terriglobales bacterium]|jgi:hypothetical protein
MRRWVSIAAFGLLVISLPAWAQRHGGGGGSGHFASHGGSASHSFSSASSSHAFHGGGFSRGSGVHLRSGNRYYNNRGLYGRRGLYPYYGAGCYPYGYCGWWDDPLAYDNSDTADDQDSYAGFYQAPAYPGPYADNSGGLQRDVQTLNGKIDRLQADIEARNHPKSDDEPATALVFRDQHVEEVHNYAIAGGTLWVLNDHQAGKKIPLAQLDLDATVKMNDQRGVDFQVPGPAMSLQIVR